MDFVTAVKTCLIEKYASFQGRASRSEYWWFVLAYVIGAVVLALLGIRFLSMLYFLALIVPLTAAGWRRLQDTGRPGWYILIPVAVSVVSMFVAPPMPHVGPGGPVPGAMPGMGRMGIAAALGIVQLVLAVIYIYWLTRPSQPETNAYGPPPRA